MTNPIRWGIIGCGDVTEVKSGPAFQLAHGSALVAVMRRNPEKAADYARRHRVPRWYSSADQLIDDPEVDAVYVATPPDTHASYALQVLARKKPCYVEKPMARTHAECLQMTSAFAAAHVPLFVAYYRRALPRFQKVKQLLDSGRLGILSSITYRYAGTQWKNDPSAWRLQPHISGGGLFADLGCHTLDLLDHLLGPLTHPAGHAARIASPGPAEDTVALSFRIANIPATASWNFAAPLQEDLLEFTGTLARLRCSTFGAEPLELLTPQGIESFDAPLPKHVQLPLIQNIVNALLQNEPPLSTGLTAARTNALMDTVLRPFYNQLKC